MGKHVTTQSIPESESARKESLCRPVGETLPAAQSEERLRDLELWERLQRRLGEADERTRLAVENLAHLLRTYGVLDALIADELAEFRLSPAKLNLLYILNTAPEPGLPMSEIGARMAVTCANITKLVDALEREGLVRRAHRPCDRRVVLAELTAEGQALLDKVKPYHARCVRQLWAGMSEEDCLQLTHLLLKLRHSAQAVPHEIEDQ